MTESDLDLIKKLKAHLDGAWARIMQHEEQLERVKERLHRLERVVYNGSIYEDPSGIPESGKPDA